jgi:hypothetical protein
MLRRPCVKGSTNPDRARVAEGESLALRAFLRVVSAQTHGAIGVDVHLGVGF